MPWKRSPAQEKLKRMTDEKTLAKRLRFINQSNRYQTDKARKQIEAPRNETVKEQYDGTIFAFYYRPNDLRITVLQEQPTVTYIGKNRQLFWWTYLSRFMNDSYLDYFVYLPRNNPLHDIFLDYSTEYYNFIDDEMDEKELMEHEQQIQIQRETIIQQAPLYKISYAPPEHLRTSLPRWPAPEGKTYKFNLISADYMLKLGDHVSISNLETKGTQYQFKQYFKDQCCLEYIYHKTNTTKKEMIDYFTERKIEYQQGLKTKDFVDYLDYLDVAYVITGFNMMILFKRSSNEVKYNAKTKTELFMYVADHHIYPIENPELQHLLLRHAPREQVDLSPDLKDLNYNDPKEVTIIPANSLNKYVIEHFEKKKTLPLVTKWQGSRCVYLKDDDKHVVCNLQFKMVKDYSKIFDIPFVNQSLTRLSVEVIEKLYHKLPHPSCYTQYEIKKMLDKTLVPCLMQFEHELKDEAKYHYLDVSRFYASILYKRESFHQYPVFYFDTWIKGPPVSIKPGRYRVNKTIKMGGGRFEIEKDHTIDNHLLAYLVTHSMIDIRNDISEYIYASKFVEPKYFHEMVKFFYSSKIMPPDFLKELFNLLVGHFGSVKKCKSTGIFTSDMESCNNFYHYSRKQRQAGQRKELIPGKLYSCHADEETYKLKNHRSLWQSVIDSSYVYMDEWIRELEQTFGKSLVIYGIKTDCLIISCDSDVELPNKPKYPSLDMIGQLCLDDTSTDFNMTISRSSTGNLGGGHFPIPEQRVIDLDKPIRSLIGTHISADDYLKRELKCKQSFKLTGIGGTGKTYLAAATIIPQLISNGYKFKVMTQANLAGNKYNDYQTLASFFPENNPGIKHPRYDYLIVDEFSCISLWYYEQLYYYQQQHHAAIILIGDTNQTLPIDTNPRDYNKLNLINEMTDFQELKLTTIKRYDDALAHALQTLIETGKIPPEIQQINNQQFMDMVKPQDVNVCYRNIFKDNSNAVLLKKFPTTGIIPYICKQNTNDFNNGQLFHLLKNQDDGDAIYDKFVDYHTGEDLKQQPNKDILHLAYCLTTHSVQGQTFSRNVFIHEAHIMDKNIIYTALSRAKSIDRVYIVGKSRDKYFPPQFKHVSVSALAKKQGAIYKLKKDGNTVYVGQVANYREIPRRMLEHKEAKQIEFDSEDHFTFKYFTMDELRDKERELIEYELKSGSKLQNIYETTHIKDRRDKIKSIDKALREQPMVYRLPYSIQKDGRQLVLVVGKNENDKGCRLKYASFGGRLTYEQAEAKLKTSVNTDPDVINAINRHFGM